MSASCPSFSWCHATRAYCMQKTRMYCCAININPFSMLPTRFSLPLFLLSGRTRVSADAEHVSLRQQNPKNPKITTTHNPRQDCCEVAITGRLAGYCQSCWHGSGVTGGSKAWRTSTHSRVVGPIWGPGYTWHHCNFYLKNPVMLNLHGKLSFREVI